MSQKTYEQIEQEATKFNEGKPVKQQIHVSRTKLGFCKNEGCNRKRRHGSAYCGEDNTQ